MKNKEKLVIVNANPKWTDTDGKHIQAHGGGILYHNGMHYWYGENKEAETKYTVGGKKGWEMHRVDVIGVSCYSSTDLVHWKNEGVVLSAISQDVNHDLHPSKVVERPKVLFNEKTKKFVMWVHIDDMEYDTARTGVAVSDSPTGPFNYIDSFKPNGVDSRDMTVFVDDDQKAYLFHSSEWNKTLYITPLSKDYLKPEGKSIRMFIDLSREAPAVFKRKSKYYIITSGCTGWDPNKAEYAIADQIEGPWEIKGNPCTGKNAEITFFAQSTYVFKIAEMEDQFVFMADIWKKEDLKSSSYIWLPILFVGDEMEIKWKDEWSILFSKVKGNLKQGVSDWKDTKGRHISAHEGGISYFNEKYFWYGTSYKNNPRGDYGLSVTNWEGFSLYTSEDLENWEYEGVVLSKPLKGFCTLFSSHRPHVIYNKNTKQYVMWFFNYIEYPAVLIMVAVSDSPYGPFRILGPRETNGPYGFGQDLNVFQDEDDVAYLVYDDGSRNIRIDRLTEDYLDTTDVSVVAIEKHHEAPAMIKWQGLYIVAASGVNGWNGTETHYTVAKNPMGPYSEKRCMSENETWGSQITCLIVKRSTDALLALCDRWFHPNKDHIDQSSYLLIPIQVNNLTQEVQMIHFED